MSQLGSSFKEEFRKAEGCHLGLEVNPMLTWPGKEDVKWNGIFGYHELKLELGHETNGWEPVLRFLRSDSDIVLLA